MPQPRRVYGWRRTPDHLRPPAADHSGLTVLPEVDPRKDMPPVFDQGQLGSCTANATAAAFQYDGMLDGKDPGLLSRLWIYYQERKLEGELGQGDTGAIGSDAFKVATSIGIPPESTWPYDITTYETVPSAAVKQEGHYRLTKPYKAPELTVGAFKAVLSNKQTIPYGFTVYSSFESAKVAKTGIVPMPGKNEEELGGHEPLVVGYLQAYPNHALCRNSWGSKDTDGVEWGIDGDGYFLMPWDYLLSKTLCGDWTTIVRPAG